MFNLLKQIAEKVSFGFNFLNRNNSSVTKQELQESTMNGDMVGRDKYQIQTTRGDVQSLSNIEKRVLKLLHQKYIHDTLPPRMQLREIYELLEIKEGVWVGPLNDSPYLKIDGEDIIMKPDGLRYMDNLNQEQLRQIVLPAEQKEIDHNRILQAQKLEENRKRNQKPFQYL